MESYQKEIEIIRQILKDNPKGMTVTDISRKININRNSVAKYLDIMRISGLVEMITFGPAKVFFPSRRVPMSSMLNYTSDYITILDKDLKIVLINDTFLDFMNTKRGEIIGQTIDDAIISIFQDNADISLGINEALEGKDFIGNIVFQMKGEELYFEIRIVPPAFEDGTHGVALIINNITDHKIAEKALRDNEKNLRTLIGKIDKNQK